MAKWEAFKIQSVEKMMKERHMEKYKGKTKWVKLIIDKC